MKAADFGIVEIENRAGGRKIKMHTKLEYY